MQEKGTKSTITAQKDRIEKRITNVLDGDTYSKIKKIVKENVKAVLSDNKILISTAFAAIIQMLKSDPELVNVIQRYRPRTIVNNANIMTLILPNILNAIRIIY